MKKRKGVTIILTITLCAGLFYGYRYLRIPVETKAAAITQREEFVTTDAYVIRQEKVFSSENTGTMYNYVQEGSRVAKDMCISTVYKGNVDAELIQELNNINNKIDKLERAKIQSELFVVDNGSGENTVENVKNNIIDAVIDKNIQEIENYKNTLDSINSENEDKTQSELYDLIEQKNKIERKLSGEKNDIYATMSGIFSLNVDGLEEILTPEEILNYKVSDFNSIQDAKFSEHTTNIVNQGEKICKVVDNHTWYVMAVVSMEKAEEIKEKKEVLIRFEDLPGDEVLASVSYISEEEDREDNVVIVLKSDRYLEGVYGMRSGKMDIIINRYVGYEVPVYSLRVFDENQGVVISGGNTEIFCQCDIIYRDDEKQTAIIYPSNDAKRKLTTGDRIVLGEKK